MIRWIRSSGRRGSTALLALLLLCLTLQSTLVFACDLHDLAHASTRQAGAGATGAHADMVPPDRTQDGSSLHDVLHAAHCCVHVSALPPTLAVALAFARDDLAFAYGLPSSSDAYPANLLRPPIAG